MNVQELLDVADMLHAEAERQYGLHLDGMPGMTRAEIAEWLTDIEGRIRQQAAAC